MDLADKNFIGMRHKMKVISINDIIKKPEEENEERIALRKQNLLDILDHIKDEIEAGNITEIVATSLDTNGDARYIAM